MLRRLGLVLAVAAAAAIAVRAQTPTPNCPRCAEWNAPQQPVRLFGNTYYVGPHGVSSVLITSDRGHVLIDGGLSESAPVIAGHIRELGFRVEDVKLIVNSHVHYDHAGGIGELQRLSGAAVAASPLSAPVLTSGSSEPNDPQYGLLFPIAQVHDVRRIADGETLHAGGVEITAHFTPGHTPGGTSWTWRSCEGARCLDMVYADSVTPVSADTFLFTASRDYPNAVADFEKTLGFFERVPCDIVVAAHPEAVDLWKRLDRRSGGDANGLVDQDACKRYAASGRRQLAARLERERAAQGQRP
jgi:metallo-beta-lactamase class B